MYVEGYGRSREAAPVAPGNLTSMEKSVCEGDTLAFRLGDADRHLAGVRLAAHVVGVDRYDFDYDATDRAWQLRIPRPALWRLEYLLDLTHRDGGTETILDPDNPNRVGGAFGDKSVLLCPGYREPEWLHRPARSGTWRELAVPAPPVKATVSVRIWSPEVPTNLILLAHDGPEYDRLAGLGHYSAAADVPPHHLVLLTPGDRNEWYSANPAYAWALVADVLPRVYAAVGPGPTVAMGASLGALAMLHAHRRYPQAFDGLFLQSGSFFLPRFDRHESGFQRYLRIVRFVGRVHRADTAANTVPTTITCGLAEENLANNRECARTLARQGYPVTIAEVPDAHNYTCWRDAFDPNLSQLLKQVANA
jgi:enterochelin esterase-like enzyme